jgi:hypothetical protein
MKLQPTVGARTAHTSLASLWSVPSATKTTATPHSSAATTMARVRAGVMSRILSARAAAGKRGGQSSGLFAGSPHQSSGRDQESGRGFTR